MTRFDPARLEKNSHTKLLLEFWQAIQLIRDDTESNAFFRDLLHPQELIMLARRIQIGKMLRQGYNYAEIALILRTAPNTIVKINRSLDHGHGGLAAIVDRLLAQSSHPKPGEQFSWEYVKRTYASHFWPTSQLTKLETKWRILAQSRRTQFYSTPQSIA